MAIPLIKNSCWFLTMAAGALMVCFAQTSAASESDARPAPGGAATSADAAQHFKTQVAPLLMRHCTECHGAMAKKGRLDLSRQELALAGGDSGPAIVPGKASESLLWEYVESGEMPANRPPLSEREKEILRRWIDAGAVWPKDVVVGGAPDDAGASDWLRRLTVPEYIETVRQAVGVDVEREARRILPRDVRADGFSNTAYNLNVDLEHVEAYAQLAEMIVARMDVPAFAAQFSQCQQLSDDCMVPLIAAMGKWLLRGPLEQHETDAFLKVVHAVADEGGDFHDAVGYVVEAMLQSPRFLYRIERQPGDGGQRRLGQYELASRLSYILWGGPPDKQLMQAADAGELADREQVAQQVQRMLKDPRTVDRSSQFIAQWLNLEQLDYLRPDEKRFPRWNASLAADMRDETLAFFHEIAWQQKRPLWELMNAKVTFVTPRLAKHYGFDPTKGVAAGPARALVGRTANPSHKESSNPSRREPVRAGLQVLYRFDEAGGQRVRDTAGSGEPLDLEIEDAKAVVWTDGGLTVKESTRIATAGPAERLTKAIKESGAVTVEAWVTPADATQAGPARIATLSSDTNARNVTLGQDGDRYDVRFRTRKTNGNGMPGLASPSGTVQMRRTQVVYTRDASGKTRLYLDGRRVSDGAVAGDLSNWDGGYRFAVANELSKDRPWKGTLHRVALYNRALSAEEVQQNHAAGAGQDQPSALAALPSRYENRVEEAGLQVLYRFDEGNGQRVRDTAGSGEPLDLKIEDAKAVAWTDDGLTVKRSTRIGTAGPAERLIKAVEKSNALTLEALITPANDSQSGPARILTLSAGTGARNFTLGQDGKKYEVRLRTSVTDANGLPGLATPSGDARSASTHVVYTRDAGGKATLYIDGEVKAESYVQGTLSTWDGSFSLGLANETSGDRAWLGTLHRVAIYSRALAPEEVRAKSRNNVSLARHDLAAVPGRGGLLTQGSVLTIGGDDASMVTRGLFILKDVLYSQVGDPPPCLDTTPVPTKPGLSQREVAMTRIQSASCGGCHSKFEPLAFGLEKFDGLGTYREKDEHGNKLRDDGEIQFPDADKPVAFRSSAELMDLLAGSQRVRKNITRKVAQFALGRPLVAADAPVIDEIHVASEQGGGTYASLITAIVMSDLVQMTSMETDQ